MSLYFDFKFPEDPVVAYGPPGWCIDLRIEIRYPDGSTDQSSPNAEVDAVYVEGKFQGVTIWPGAWLTATSTIGRGVPGMLTPRLPLTRDLIQAIEKARAGSAPLQFIVTLKARGRIIIQSGDLGHTFYTPQRTQIVNCNSSPTLTIDRDRWAAILKKVGWSEIEVFEVEPGALGDDPAVQDAIGRLRQAEHAFRTRTGPDDVLVHCFKALEGIAKTKGAGDLTTGFKVLMEETFPKDEGKRALVNEVIRKVKDFAHFGRHEEVPPVAVSFDEARFILTTTMGLMQLITTNGRSRQR